MIVGHGLVERQVRGPASARGVPESLVVTLRRYRCRACRAIVVVGPRGLVRGRWYGAGAIAVALAAYARGEASAVVRRRSNPWSVVGPSAQYRWMTLVRWIDAARAGRLFAVPGLHDMPRRRAAEQVALALAARGGRDLGGDLDEAAFAGAAIAA